MPRIILWRFRPVVFLLITCMMGNVLAQNMAVDVHEGTPIMLHSPLTDRRLQTALVDCKVIGECEMCTFSDQKGMDACKETGRREKRECTATDGDDSKTITEYYSCKYTPADDQFAMIRMQMICALLGFIAFGSVRRQKRASASLFEQRKLAAEEARKRAQEKRRINSTTSNEEEQIEFSTIQEQEKAPLVSSRPSSLEII